MLHHEPLLPPGQEQDNAGDVPTELLLSVSTSLTPLRAPSGQYSPTAHTQMCLPNSLAVPL